MGKGDSRNSYKDIREWMKALESEGQLARIKKQVDWKYEMATIVRRTWDVYGDASPTLMFENIKDYPSPGPSKVMTGAFRSWYRTAMMLGLNPQTTTRNEIISTLRKRCTDQKEFIPPIMVKTGPVKENILKGDDVDLTKLPVPYWNERDGGRFIGSFHSVITRDPDSAWVNVGTYRMMMYPNSINETGIQADPANQHLGAHYYKYIQRNKPMPVAVVIGQEPALTFMACTPTVDQVSEMDIAGAIRGEALEVVKCETNDLYVPANAEIVLEGTIHPKERKMEGPCGEYPGYYGSVPGPKPVFRVKCMTFRNDPVFRGTLEGHPVNEDHSCLAVSHSAYVAETLHRAGVPGVIDVAMPLDACGYAHCVVSIKPVMEGHAAVVASAIWGSKANVWAFKHVIVVDEDIDPWNSEQVNWSIAWRFRASEDLHVWKNHKGSRLDPRMAPDEKGFQDRMLIDATRPYHWAPRDIWGTEGVQKGIPLKFPPTTRPQTELAIQVNEQWDSYGISPTTKYIGRPEGMMKHWWNPEEIKRVINHEIWP